MPPIFSTHSLSSQLDSSQSLNLDREFCLFSEIPRDNSNEAISPVPLLFPINPVSRAPAIQRPVPRFQFQPALSKLYLIMEPPKLHASFATLDMPG